MKDDRDKSLLVGTFLFIKVMAGKLFFKPYKIARFFEIDIHDLHNPGMFKENCLAIGYTFIALMTDMLFETYKVELDRIEGKTISKSADVLRVK